MVGKNKWSVANLAFPDEQPKEQSRAFSKKHLPTPTGGTMKVNDLAIQMKTQMSERAYEILKQRHPVKDDLNREVTSYGISQMTAGKLVWNAVAISLPIIRESLAKETMIRYMFGYAFVDYDELKRKLSVSLHLYTSIFQEPEVKDLKHLKISYKGRELDEIFGYE